MSYIQEEMDSRRKATREEINEYFHQLFQEAKGRKMITMTRRFYLGSKSVVNGDNLCTLGQAIDKARAAIRDGDEERYIVEVVKIVRCKPVEDPIIVEDVRRD